MSMIFNTDWQGGFMQTILRTPFFLILFTIFSVSFSVSSATGQALGQTFMTYQPPDIACERAGAWAPVDNKGNAIKQGNPPRVNWGVFTCEVAGPGPGEAGKFNGVSERPDASYRYVFANPGNPDTGNVVGLPGDGDASYNFETGVWTTTAGQFKDGVSIGGSSGITPPTPTPGVPPVINGAYQGQPGLPVVSGSYQGQPIPPSDNPLEAAIQAKELAEQNVTTATTDLDEAKAARLAAEQKLADAKTALEKAEQDLEKAIADKDAELQVAEKAVEDARQILADAKSAWVTAKNEVMELENKLNTVKNTYKEAEKTTRGAERALFVAENNVRRLKGQSELPVVGGSYMEQPGLPVVGGSYMGQSGLPVVGGSYQGPPQ